MMETLLVSSSSSLQIIIIILLLCVSSQCRHGAAEDGGITLALGGVRSSNQRGWELDERNYILEMHSKDLARLQYLSSSSLAVAAGIKNAPIASGRQIIQTPSYVVRVQIGTPAQTMLMAVDTSSDAAWLPCLGCIGCSSNLLFDSAKSTTFKPVTCQSPLCNQVPNPTCGGGGSACNYNMTYGGSSIAVSLSQDTLTLATDPIQSYTLGCIHNSVGNSVPPQGLLGLGRGPLSLLSQSQSLYKSTFSYCLPSYKSSPNFSGSLRLGPVGQPFTIKYTPLLRNPRRSSLYYVNLIAILVGNKIVDIPPPALAFNPTTGAGTIFDSGTVFSRLVGPAYVAVRDEFRKRVGSKLSVSSLGGFDTCYTVPIVAPSITLMFSGMNVTLPPENVMIHSSAGSTTCLAMAAAPDNLNSVLNVIANMQQQNHRILFDVPNSRIGVAREPCSS